MMTTDHCKCEWWVSTWVEFRRAQFWVRLIGHLQVRHAWHQSRPGRGICTQNRQAPSRGRRAKKRECVCLLQLDTLLFLFPVDIAAPVPPDFIVQDLLCGLGLRVSYALCSLGLEASGLDRESSLQITYKLIPGALLSPWLQCSLASSLILTYVSSISSICPLDIPTSVIHQ